MRQKSHHWVCRWRSRAAASTTGIRRRGRWNTQAGVCIKEPWINRHPRALYDFVIGGDGSESEQAAISVEPDRLKTLKVFVRQPREHIAGPAVNFTFVVEDRASHERDQYVATFNAPEASK